MPRKLSSDHRSPEREGGQRGIRNRTFLPKKGFRANVTKYKPKSRNKNETISLKQAFYSSREFFCAASFNEAGKLGAT